MAPGTQQDPDGATISGTRWIHPAIERKISTTVVSNPELDRALAARAGGETEQAFQFVEQALHRDPGNADLATVYWDLALELERADAAAPTMLRVIEHDLQNDRAAAAERWLGLLEHVPDVRPDGVLLVRLAQVLAADGPSDAARVTLRMAMLTGAGGLGPAWSLKLARIASRLDGRVARAAALLARDAADADPEVKAEAGRMLAELSRQAPGRPAF